MVFKINEFPVIFRLDCLLGLPESCVMAVAEKNEKLPYFASSQYVDKRLKTQFTLLQNVSTWKCLILRYRERKKESDPLSEVCMHVSLCEVNLKIIT